MSPLKTARTLCVILACLSVALGSLVVAKGQKMATLQRLLDAEYALRLECQARHSGFSTKPPVKAEQVDTWSMKSGHAVSSWRSITSAGESTLNARMVDVSDKALQQIREACR